MASYDKIASELKRLNKQGKLKARDLAEWLRSKGVEVSGRPSIDKLIDIARRSRKIKLSDLEEYIETITRESEEYEREIIIREKGKRSREQVTRSSRRKKEAVYAERVREPIIDLALELWPGMSASQILARLYTVLDEIGVGYKKARSLTELVSKLSDTARSKLYDKLLEIKSWREFQEEVHNWVKANIDLVHYIIDNGGIYEQEYTEHGASGVAYRFDSYGFLKESGLLSSSVYLVLVEAKKMQDPLGLEHILVFRGKALDMVERFRPSEAFLAIFSDSGFTERAIKYVRRWGVYEHPIKLFEKRGRKFVLVAETDEEYL